MLPESGDNRRAAEWASGAGVALAPRGDALLAVDVRALEADGVRVLFLADGAAVLAELHQLGVACILADRQAKPQDSLQRDERSPRAVDERDELEANVQVRAADRP